MAIIIRECDMKSIKQARIILETATTYEDLQDVKYFINKVLSIKKGSE